jgi:hypothetical protein
MIKIIEARKNFLEAVANGEKRRSTNKLLSTYREVLEAEGFTYEKLNNKEITCKIEANEIVIFDEEKMTFTTINK